MKTRNKIEALFGVVVIGAGALVYNTGGFGAVSRTGSSSVSALVPAATLLVDDVTLSGDASGTSLGETVINMQPGDVRERLVSLRSPADGPLSLGYVSYAVSAQLVSDDPTFTTVAGIGQPGDATDVLSASNAGATAGATPTTAVAGQGGLAIELYYCNDIWVRSEGVIAGRTDDIDYSCASGSTTNGELIGSLIDVPATGASAPVRIEDAPAFTSNLRATRTGSVPVLIRVRFVSDGTTNGRQNPMQNETVELTHRFVADQAFPTDPAVR